MTFNESHVTHDATTENSDRRWHRWANLWRHNKGALLILISELIGTCMDAIVRYLQQGDDRMHPLQLMFARTTVICLLSSLYMWWISVPDFPFGPKSMRLLLVLRSFCGASGLACFYYAARYLPLAEATIFRFLVPIPTAFTCYLVLGTSFTRKEVLAGLFALMGVIIVAHPVAIFGHVDDRIHSAQAGEVDKVSSSQRIAAIIVMLLGTFGTIGAYTCIRIIGNKAHALISVNYFAVLGLVGSTVGLLAIPETGFTKPHGIREWLFLVLLGILGFLLQFMLTAGLQLDKSSKATSMIYTQIIFALAFDWVIWRVIPGLWSFVGGAIVIASTFWAALQKPKAPKVASMENVIPDEESALLGAQTHDTGDIVRK